MKKNPKPRGRPIKSDLSRKGQLMQVRISALEKQGFSEAAELSGQELSVWVRDVLRYAAEAKLRQHGKQIPFLPSTDAPNV